MSMPRMTFDQAHTALLNFIPKAKELIEEGTEHAQIAQRYLVKAEALLSQITDTKKNDIEINGIINANLKDLNRFIAMMPLMESELTPPPPPPIEPDANTATAPQTTAAQAAPGNSQKASVYLMFEQLDSKLTSLFDTVKAKGGDAKLEGTLNDLIVSCRTIPSKSSAKPDGGLAEMIGEMAKACKAHDNAALIQLTSSTAAKCKDNAGLKTVVDTDRVLTLLASITAPKATVPKAVAQSHEQTNQGPSHKMK